MILISSSVSWSDLHFLFGSLPLRQPWGFQYQAQGLHSPVPWALDPNDSWHEFPLNHPEVSHVVTFFGTISKLQPTLVLVAKGTIGFRFGSTLGLGWKLLVGRWTFLLGWPIFGGEHVGFREGTRLQRKQLSHFSKNLFFFLIFLLFVLLFSLFSLAISLNGWMDSWWIPAHSLGGKMWSVWIQDGMEGLVMDHTYHVWVLLKIKITQLLPNSIQKNTGMPSHPACLLSSGTATMTSRFFMAWGPSLISFY